MCLAALGAAPRLPQISCVHAQREEFRASRGYIGRLSHVGTLTGVIVRSVSPVAAGPGGGSAGGGDRTPRRAQGGRGATTGRQPCSATVGAATAAGPSNGRAVEPAALSDAKPTPRAQGPGIPRAGAAAAVDAPQPPRQAAVPAFAATTSAPAVGPSCGVAAAPPAATPIVGLHGVAQSNRVSSIEARRATSYGPLHTKVARRGTVDSRRIGGGVVVAQSDPWGADGTRPSVTAVFGGGIGRAAALAHGAASAAAVAEEEAVAFRARGVLRAVAASSEEEAPGGGASAADSAGGGNDVWAAAAVAEHAREPRFARLSATAPPAPRALAQFDMGQSSRDVAWQ